MILLFFDRFSPFFPEPGVFTGSHIFFWDRNNVAVISASHVALWGTSFLREDFLNAFEPLVFYIYVDMVIFFFLWWHVLQTLSLHSSWGVV